MLSVMARDELPMDSGESHLSQLEQSVADGNADTVGANLPALRKLIGQYQDRIIELANLQYRARLILEQHEPSADERGRT
jgi:hypothetical protein